MFVEKLVVVAVFEEWFSGFMVVTRIFMEMNIHHGSFHYGEFIHRN